MDLFLLSIFILCSTSALGAIYETLEGLPTLDFDFIIIGGGTAGNVLANRLTEDPDISVLVLEAGGSTEDVLLSQVPFFCPQVTPNTPLDWNFTTTEQPGLNGRSISYPRGYGLGGSSAVNYMLYTRGSSQDYDRYAQTSSDPGWGWEALQPYFQKNERFVPPADRHNTSGEFDPVVHGFDGVNSVSLPGYPRGTDGRVIQATKELHSEFPFNLDYNSGYHLGIGWTPSTIGNGTRSSSQTSYLGPEYVGRPNLHVLIRAYVTRILPSDTTSISALPTFKSVEFIQDGGVHILAPSNLKEIILSAGSIGSPHILLNSGIGPRTELAALGIQPVLHLPDVGKNLTDHPRYITTFFVNSTDTIENVYFRNTTFQSEVLAEWQANRTGFLSGGVDNQIGFLRIPHDAGVVEGEPCAGNETAHYELIFSNGLTREPIPDTGNYFSVTTVVLCPLSRGSVTINSTDPLEPPLINPNYFSHQQDVASMQYAITSAQKFLTAPVWEDYILGIATNTTEDDIRDGVRSIYHPIGTASMSPPGADWGVVDPDLKLKGANGVRVVDASVLPFLPSAHTQVPVYVIAERAADLIRAGYTLRVKLQR
ncbi:aryl-alcohol oxidase precursor [Armillaria borealis]|uniref:Aryl-alcohol oxidase n=1 Tax=Armillaria borealis TaxID=47425 RepID=A0AA39JR55_9AGAR|nr:aryl-alcohol oxidase precursor [Armillaria borealis]